MRIRKKWREIPREKKIIFLMVICIFFLLSSKSSMSCMGQGEITKNVRWFDETPIEGAFVFLETCDMNFSGYTDADGMITFLDLPSGEWELWVDIDNDGVFDEDYYGELVDLIVLSPGESKYILNWYPLPTMQDMEEFKNEQI